MCAHQLFDPSSMVRVVELFTTTVRAKEIAEKFDFLTGTIPEVRYNIDDEPPNLYFETVLAVKNL